MSSFHGYRVAAVASLAFAATGPGQTVVISQLNLHLRQDLGLGETELAGAYMVATLLAALPLVYVGALTDRFGPRRALAVAAVLFGLGCAVFAAMTQGLWTLLLGFFLLRFLGQGALSLVGSHALALWFHRRLGTLNGVKSVVGFVGWALLPPLVLASTGWVGWRWTYVLLGIGVAAVVVVPALLFVRDTPESVGQHLDGVAPTEPEPEAAFTLSEAIRTSTYWILTAAIALTTLIGTALLFTLQPLAVAADLPLGVAAWAAAAWSWTLAVVSLPAGWVVDRWRPALVLPPGLLLLGGSAAVFVVADSALGFVLAMVGVGIAQSAISASSTTALARTFGRAHHGAIRASVTRLLVIGTALGPVILGASQDVLGTYTTGLWVLAAMCLPVALVAAAVPREIAR